MNEQRTGIIDIGSNSIRLVVYEQTASGAHRVIDGSKRPARLSSRITPDGRIDEDTTRELIEILSHFRMICAHHRTNTIRAVATAALRNAANGEEVIAILNAESGLEVELLPGEEEAGFGFLGMINTMDVRDGFLIDIGGGSTEISLFRERTLVQSISFPFGCVSLSRRYSKGGQLDDEGLKELEAVVSEAASKEPWLTWSPGLSMIGVGGTLRALAKIHQAVRKYPFQQTHNYTIPPADTDRLFYTLREMPVDKRRKFPGLSKDRVDLIVPGLAVLRIFQKLTGSAEYRICGAGLRDGLFFAEQFPDRPRLDDVLGYSVKNTYALYPEAPLAHVNQVNRLSMQLLEALQDVPAAAGLLPLQDRSAVLLDASSFLYRIGASIDYSAYAKHTFYLLTNCSLNGMSHRENVLTAAIASFRNRSRLKTQLEPFSALLQNEDAEAAVLLGSILQLAATLDRSETQPISRLQISVEEGKLHLQAVRPSGSLALECQEIEESGREFEKIWNLTPRLSYV